MLACTEDSPQEPSINEPHDLDVHLAINYQMASNGPDDYLVGAIPKAGGVLVDGAILVPNGGYLVSPHAQMNNNEIDLTLSFRNFGGITIPMRVAYVAFVSPVTSGDYLLSVTHRVEHGDTTVVGTPIVREPISVP